MIVVVDLGLTTVVAFVVVVVAVAVVVVGLLVVVVGILVVVLGLGLEVFTLLRGFLVVVTSLKGLKGSKGAAIEFLTLATEVLCGETLLISSKGSNKEKLRS